MKTSFISRLIVMLVVVAMVVSAVGCQPAAPVDSGAPQGGEQTAAPVETSGTPEAEPTYTYNAAMSASPVKWNPHTWETDDDESLSPYIETPLVSATISEDGETFEWVYEGATAITDITSTFEGREEWGISEDMGRVFQIDLNPAMCWEDGTPINADSYVYSMQQLLDPAMKNYRANSYYTGSYAVQGAAGYYNNDKVGQPIFGENVDENGAVINAYSTWIKGEDGAYTTADGGALKFVLNESLAAYSGYSAAELCEYGYIPVEYYDAMAAFADENGDIPVTDESIAAVFAFIGSEDWHSETMDDLANYVFCQVAVYEETPWEKVGVFANGEYQLIYILENPCSMFYFLSSIGRNWLVYEKLYEEGKSTIEGLVATNYQTSAETTMSFGPYKLVSFEVDKQMVFAKNENWYGYTDGTHDGQYTTTDVKVEIISDHNTQMQLFLQGKLDVVDLGTDDMSAYRMSDYLLKTEQTYTARFVFASDIEALAALEDEANDGANKKVLSYDDFRKAISLSMDRARLTGEATAAYKPAYFLLNYQYFYDIENDPASVYRNSIPAMDAVLKLYDIEYGEGKPYATAEEAYAAVTGYDVEGARALFQSVYEQAIADGNYTDGQAIHINCMCGSAATMTPDGTRQQDLMNEFVATATVGTGFEGKITFNFMTGATDRYKDVANGRIEMIVGSWGDAAYHPFYLICVYTEPDFMGGLDCIEESCGWNPMTETLDIVYDFDGDGTAETVTDTFQNWAKSINDGTYMDIPTKLAILAGLEGGVLEAYQCIPWATETYCSLFSRQIEYATLDYNSMYQYGGIRLMTYNYSDAEWDAYVTEQGGQLNYE